LKNEVKCGTSSGTFCTNFAVEAPDERDIGLRVRYSF